MNGGVVRQNARILCDLCEEHSFLGPRLAIPYSKIWLKIYELEHLEQIPKCELNTGFFLIEKPLSPQILIPVRHASVADQFMLELLQSTFT